MQKKNILNRFKDVLGQYCAINQFVELSKRCFIADYDSEIHTRNSFIELATQKEITLTSYDSEYMINAISRSYIVNVHLCFETFLKESISKKNWGQYFTPLKVVRAIVNMVDLSPGMEVCDPACGVGKFLLEPICNDLHRFFLVEDGKCKPQIALHGFDKGVAELLNNTFLLQTNSILGTLARPEADRYDLILTNPPYVMSGSSNLKEEIGKN